ncbi:hypothetical protein E2C01_027426 [Portunus trituberculatus]|uniref:Uncharacterized protein n=1 Tax=Portunus trituberculatus TaxID=210409 RepID=A0A5B7ENQ3_PORTR|nr:hypothetical protein [Portunus trituberculatus]
MGNDMNEDKAAVQCNAAADDVLHSEAEQARTAPPKCANKQKSKSKNGCLVTSLLNEI